MTKIVVSEGSRKRLVEELMAVNDIDRIEAERSLESVLEAPAQPTIKIYPTTMARAYAAERITNNANRLTPSKRAQAEFDRQQRAEADEKAAPPVKVITSKKRKKK